MMGVRDINVFPLYGTRKNAGDIGAPLFPTNGISTYVAAVGADGGDYTLSLATTPTFNNGVTGTYTSPAASTTLSVAVSAYPTVLNTTSGSTTVTVNLGSTPGSAIPVSNFPGAVAVSAGTTVTGTTLSAAATATGQAISGTSSITVASATGITTGSVIQIDINSSTTSAEVRKVTNVASSVLTLDTPLYFTHLTGVAVKVVTAPYTHQILQANSLPSLTVEKVIGGYQSLQFTGAKIDKYSLKADAGESAVSFTAGMITKSYNVLNSPTTPTPFIQNELPFVFAEAQVHLFDSTGADTGLVAQVSNVSLDIENGLKPTYTFNNSHDLQFLTPVSRKITGQFDVVFTSLNDATWGFFNTMQNQVQGALTLTFTHPTSSNQVPGAPPVPATSSGYSFSITLPAVNIAKYADAIKLEDVVMTTLNFEAAYSLTTASTISTTIGDARWLPF